MDTSHKYVRRVVSVTEAAGATPILYMARPDDRLDWNTQDEISDAHDELAEELDLEVASVGGVWSVVMDERDDLNLYDTDEEHPSRLGRDLAASVICATLSQSSA